jgi:hypothetical protein
MDRPDPQELKARLEKLAGAMAASYPKAILLFGSVVGFLESSEKNSRPNDLDILMIGDNPLPDIDLEAVDPPVELHRFRTAKATAIARSLRYDSRALALSKLYASNVAAQHARDVILASMLLGPGYTGFGIEQIEIRGRLDTRDYSRHLVLFGRAWWGRLCAWARERRTLFQRMADKMVAADRFTSP